MIFNCKWNYGIFISLHYLFTYHLPVLNFSHLKEWNLKPNDTNILYFLGSGPQYRNVRVWAGTQRKASEGVWTVSEQFQNLLRLSSWEPSVILLLTFLLVGKNKTKHLVFLDWGKSIHMSLKRFQKCIWTQWIYFPLWTIFNQVIINTYKN